MHDKTVSGIYQFSNKVGIDKCTLSLKFVPELSDETKIRKAIENGDIEVVLTEDEEKYVFEVNGKKYQQFKIVDSKYVSLDIKYDRNLRNQEGIHSRLHIYVDPGEEFQSMGNIRNNGISELKAIVSSCLDKYADYGLAFKKEATKFSYVEINRTFMTGQQFDTYKSTLHYVLEMLPSDYDRGGYAYLDKSNCLKLDSSEKKKRKRRVISSFAGIASTIQIVCYDKAHEVSRTKSTRWKKVSIDENLMRLEIRLKGKSLIDYFFNNPLLFFLDDNKLKNIWENLMYLFIINPIEISNENRKTLMEEYFSKISEPRLPQRWPADLVNACLEKEIEDGYVIMVAPTDWYNFDIVSSNEKAKHDKKRRNEQWDKYWHDSEHICWSDNLDPYDLRSEIIDKLQAPPTDQEIRYTIRKKEGADERK